VLRMVFEGLNGMITHRMLEQNGSMYGKRLAKVSDRYCNVVGFPTPFPFKSWSEGDERSTASVGDHSIIHDHRLKSWARLDYF
jgi:hypothetical protein